MSNLVFITKCRLCPKSYQAHGLVVENNVPSTDTMKFIMKLNEHVSKAHPNEYTHCFLSGQQLHGLMVMSQFESSDPKFQAEIDSIRHQVHKQTRKYRVSDDKLRMKAHVIAARLRDAPTTEPNLKPEDILLEALTEMRAILEEFPPFSPGNQPEPLPQIVVP
jgi:hypothetical protein